MASENVNGNGGAESDAPVDRGGNGGVIIDPIFGDGTPIIDPAKASGNSEGGDNGNPEGGKRRRGRPKGSKNASSKARASVHIDASGIEKLLFSIHSGIAMLTRIPELAIEESEARSMAEAVTRVSRHYPALDNISEKAIDHANLAVVLCGIYGTRIAAYSMRRTSEKSSNKTATVITPDFNIVAN